MRLTATAAEMIQTLTAEADLPGGGLRIAQEHEHPGLTMEVVPAPRPHDDVTRQRGVRLFLDPVAVDRLNGQVLDGRTNAAGAAFFLHG